MARALVLLALVTAPLALVTARPLQSADEPARATDPTTGASSTGTGTGTDTDTGTDTATMPPVYEPCGCRGAGEGGLWAALALLFTAGAPCRPRRPTTRRSCRRAA